MEITIRPYQSADRSAVITLMSAFNQYIQSIDDTHRTRYLEGSSEYFTDKMIRLCQTNQGIVYVACGNDEIIGFVSGYVDEQDPDEKMETIPAVPGVIGELFVSAKFRQRQIGKQLLDRIELYLRSKGCTILRFTVFAPNGIARQFYEQAGYVERLINMVKELGPL